MFHHLQSVPYFPRVDNLHVPEQFFVVDYFSVRFVLKIRI